MCMQPIKIFNTSKNERALEIKAALGLDPKVEFVTVTGAYIQWGIE